MKHLLIELMDLIATHHLGDDHEPPESEDVGDGGNFNDTYDMGWANGAHYVVDDLKTILERALKHPIDVKEGQVYVPAI